MGMARAFFVGLDEDRQSSAAAERESVPFELCAREKFVCERKILPAGEIALRVRGALRDSAYLTIVGNLRAHARCALVPPLRGLRSY